MAKGSSKKKREEEEKLREKPEGPEWEHLTAENLHKLENGKIGHLIDEAIHKMMLDLGDRPHLKKPRKITIEITGTPVGNDAGSLDSANILIEVKDKVPPTGIQPYRVQVKELPNRHGEYEPHAVFVPSRGAGGRPSANEEPDMFESAEDDDAVIDAADENDLPGDPGDDTNDDAGDDGEEGWASEYASDTDTPASSNGNGAAKPMSQSQKAAAKKQAVSA